MALGLSASSSRPSGAVCASASGTRRDSSPDLPVDDESMLNPLGQWIIAGDDALHRGFHRSLYEAAETHGWVVDAVRLPSPHVLHTGVAIAQVLMYLDSASEIVSSKAAWHCAVSEACLRDWPSAYRAAHKSRLGNMNHCLRAFGVDGGSPHLLEKQQQRKHSGEALLRSSLRSYMVLGVGQLEASTFRLIARD